MNLTLKEFDELVARALKPVTEQLAHADMEITRLNEDVVELKAELASWERMGQQMVAK